MSLSLAVDAGGTFTDLVLTDTASGHTWIAKTPSAADPTEAVLAGIARVCENSGTARGDIVAMHYGSTAALNVLLTRQGARIGLVTTAGFGQILHLARSQTPGPLVGWLNWVKPDPLVPLELTREIPERVRSDGTVELPLDVEATRGAVGGMAARGVEAIAVVFLHSYANASHELEVRRIAEEVAPDLHVTLSHEVLPEYREYERAMTAVVNTYISPSVSRSLADFGDRLRADGVDCAVNIVRSDGGLMSSEAAAVRPVETIISGPSGGVAGALAVATASGLDDILTLDMGGTSTDVSLCTAGTAQISRDTVVGDLPVRSPSLDVRSIGAGGGSIAFVPELLRGLRVGPRSAGADPGPVCYGQGGAEPTVTDANLVLGRLPAGLLGGEITLDRDAAERALHLLGSPLGLTPQETAKAVVDIANEKMAGALRIISVERGLDPRDYALVAFGGAGPLHGNALAALLGCFPVLVPPAPGVLSAYGYHTVGHRNTFSRTLITELRDDDRSEAAEAFGELVDRAEGWLAAQGLTGGTLAHSCDLRFLRQGYEIEVDVPVDRGGDIRLEALADIFRTEHHRLYEFIPDAPIEIVNVRVEARGPAAHIAPKPRAVVRGDGDHARASTEQVYQQGGWAEAGVYERDHLRPGDAVSGPAIITQTDTTTFVFPGHVAVTDAWSNLLITPEEFT
ncbi:MAG: hydantoinase/oxoprolinase family protein [bacterium]|nr:hydantoinase/oxoprolinase family protein [bacterium]